MAKAAIASNDASRELDRSAQIDPFLHGELEGARRTEFVDQLRTDSALRTAVRERRSLLLERDLPALSEEVCAQVTAMVRWIYHGNSLFPGSDDIRGEENRPGTTEDRNRCYDAAIGAAEKLIAWGVLEDLAYETMERARENKLRGVQAEKYFPAYDRYDLARVEVSVTAPPRSSNEAFAQPFRSVDLAFARPAHKGVQARLDQGVRTDSERRDLIGEFWEEYPSYLMCRPYGGHGACLVSAWAGARELSDSERSLIDAARTDGALRAAFFDRLSGPFQGTDIDKEIASRLVIARILVHSPVSESGLENVRPLIELYRSHARELGTSALSEKQLSYFEGLGHVLFAAADGSDILWNEIKVETICAVREGPLCHAIACFPTSSDPAEIIDFLGEARTRVATDALLQQAIETRLCSSLQRLVEFFEIHGPGYELEKSKSRPRDEALQVISNLQKLIDDLPLEQATALQSMLFLHPRAPSETASTARTWLMQLAQRVLPGTEGEAPELAALPDSYNVAAVATYCTSKLLGPDPAPALYSAAWDSVRARAHIEYFDLLRALDPDQAQRVVVASFERGFHIESESHWTMVCEGVRNPSTRNELLARLLCTNGTLGKSEGGGDRVDELGRLGVSASQLVSRLLASEETWSEGQLKLIKRLGDASCGKRLVKMASDEKLHLVHRVLALRTLAQAEGTAQQLEQADFNSIAKLVTSTGIARWRGSEVSLSEEAHLTMVALADSVSYRMAAEALAAVELTPGTPDLTASRLVDRCLAALHAPLASATEQYSPAAVYANFLSRGIHPQLMKQYMTTAQRNDSELTPDERATRALIDLIVGQEYGPVLRANLVERNLHDQLACTVRVSLIEDPSAKSLRPSNTRQFSERLALLSIGLLADEGAVTRGTSAFNLLHAELVQRGSELLAAREVDLQFSSEVIATFAGCFARHGMFDVATKLIDSAERLLTPAECQLLTLAVQNGAARGRADFLEYIGTKASSAR